MTFAQSKFQNNVETARRLIAQFGTAGIQVSRSTPAAQASAEALNSADTQVIGSFSVVIVPEDNVPTETANLNTAYGKTKAIIAAESNDFADEIKADDFFIINNEKFIIEKSNELNPDTQFPIIFECLVSKGSG